MNKIKELFKNNKTSMLLLILDGIVIIFMISILIIHKMPGSKHNSNEIKNKAEESAESYQVINDCLLESYGMMIKGEVYTSGDKVFNFGDDNNYSGYVNSDNPNVQNWIYSLDISSDVFTLKLYNYDYSVSVFYIFDITDEGKIRLTNQFNPEDIIIFD